MDFTQPAVLKHIKRGWQLHYMLHYTELLVKFEHRPKFSSQMCVLADALKRGGQVAFWMGLLSPAPQNMKNPWVSASGTAWTPVSPSVFPGQDGAELHNIVLLLTGNISGLSVSSGCSQLLLCCSRYLSPTLGSAPTPALCGGNGDTATAVRSTTWEHHWPLLQRVPGLC